MAANDTKADCERRSMIWAAVIGVVLFVLLAWGLDWVMWLSLIVAAVVGVVAWYVLRGMCAGNAAAASASPPARAQPAPTPAAPAPAAPTPAPKPAPKAAAPAPGAAPAVAGAAARPQGLSGPRGGKADDLKKISGIGPALEKKLNGHGIYHFDQIAAFSAAELQWVDDNLVQFKGRALRDDWTGQAARLAGGGA